MDDFGKGYLFLSYFREFLFDVIKIDKSFIYNIMVDSKIEVIIIVII